VRKTAANAAWHSSVRHGCRYAGGVELWYFLNEERLRFEQDLPNSRQELLQTIKDCCRQILKVRSGKWMQ